MFLYQFYRGGGGYVITRVDHVLFCHNLCEALYTLYGRLSMKSRAVSLVLNKDLDQRLDAGDQVDVDVTRFNCSSSLF